MAQRAINFFVLIMIFNSSFLFSGNFQIKAVDTQRVKLFICIVGKKTKKLKIVADQMRKDFSFTKQFDVEVGYIPKLKNENNIKNFFNKGFPLVVFLQDYKAHKYIEWRIYDAEHAIMYAGKRYKKRGKSAFEWGHHIADSAWVVLAGQEGFFSTKISYSQEINRRGKKPLKHIYIADYNGKRRKLLISTDTVNIAARWNKDLDNPLLFYSEHTNKNVRLIAADMRGQRKIVSNFDGMNMLPAFSSDGKKAVFCASKGSGTCQLYFYEKGICKQLTKNKGNNISPTFSGDSEKLFFCSDFETRLPQIYSYEFNNEKVSRITVSGYCVSPSYCSKNNQLCYSKMVRGTMQIFKYSFQSKKHIQITSDSGNKDECSWSPCGNYLMFSVEKGRESRLSILNINSNERQFVTSKGLICCYPSWSCSYNNFAASM